MIGIDCAAQEKDVGLARAVWNGHRTEVTELAKGGQGLAVVKIIREWIGDSTTTLLALDAPRCRPRLCDLQTRMDPRAAGQTAQSGAGDASSVRRT